MNSPKVSQSLDSRGAAAPAATDAVGETAHSARLPPTDQPDRQTENARSQTCTTQDNQTEDEREEDGKLSPQEMEILLQKQQQQQQQPESTENAKNTKTHEHDDDDGQQSEDAKKKPGEPPPTRRREASFLSSSNDGGDDDDDDDSKHGAKPPPQASMSAAALSTKDDKVVHDNENGQDDGVPRWAGIHQQIPWLVDCVNKSVFPQSLSATCQEEIRDNVLTEVERLHQENTDENGTIDADLFDNLMLVRRLVGDDDGSDDDDDDDDESSVVEVQQQQQASILAEELEPTGVVVNLPHDIEVNHDHDDHENDTLDHQDLISELSEDDRASLLETATTREMMLNQAESFPDLRLFLEELPEDNIMPLDRAWLEK